VLHRRAEQPRLPAGRASISCADTNDGAGQRLPQTKSSCGFAALETVMKKVWIVRWRGLEEIWTSPQDAMDRRDQLDARGIEAELVEVVGGQRRKLD
jgi:hypothetical protein